MAVVSTWVSGSIGGNASVNTALPNLQVDVPANRTLKRVVVYGAASGTQMADGNPDKFAPITLGYNIQLGFPTTNIKTIYSRQIIVPFSHVGIDDHQLVTQNRVYTAWHGIGDNELGANLQMSWGGPVSPAMRLTFGSLFQFLVTSPVQVPMKMYYSIVMKALYQRTI